MGRHLECSVSYRFITSQLQIHFSCHALQYQGWILQISLHCRVTWCSTLSGEEDEVSLPGPPCSACWAPAEWVIFFSAMPSSQQQVTPICGSFPSTRPSGDVPAEGPGWCVWAVISEAVFSAHQAPNTGSFLGEGHCLAPFREELVGLASPLLWHPRPPQPADFRDPAPPGVPHLSTRGNVCYRICYSCIC